MCNLRKIFMYTIFCVVFVRGTAEWIPYNGLWYYISDDNDKLTHAEAVGKCKSLQGRLAVHSGWPEDMNKLASFTGSAKRWIYLSRVLYELDPHSGTVYNLTASNADDIFGYICDWQCSSLGVYPRMYTHTGEDFIENTDIKNNFVLKVVYDLNAFDHALRQAYIYKQLGTMSTQSKIRNIWRGDNNYDWCFNYNNTDYICKSSSSFTPYNDPYTWNVVNTSNPIPIHFFCRDCDRYWVSLQVGSNTESGTFYKPRYSVPTEHVFINSEYRNYLKYIPSINKWELKWKNHKYWFGYLISPTMDHIMEFETSEMDVNISLLCTTYTYAAQQSPAPYTESDTTLELNAKATTSTVSNSPMFTEINAVSEVQSDKNSKTVDIVAIAHDGTTKEPKSDENRSDNKTTIYIAIGCIVGGVVIIIFISIGIVCGRRRKMNKRNCDAEHNIQTDIANAKANIYSVDIQDSNNTKNFDPKYEQLQNPKTENVYSEA